MIRRALYGGYIAKVVAFGDCVLTNKCKNHILKNIIRNLIKHESRIIMITAPQLPTVPLIISFKTKNETVEKPFDFCGSFSKAIPSEPAAPFLWSLLYIPVPLSREPTALKEYSVGLVHSNSQNQRH